MATDEPRHIDIRFMRTNHHTYRITYTEPNRLDCHPVRALRKVSFACMTYFTYFNYRTLQYFVHCEYCKSLNKARPHSIIPRSKHLAQS